MYYYKTSNGIIIDIEKIVSMQPQGNVVLITMVDGSTIPLRTQESTYSIKGFKEDGSVDEYEIIKGCIHEDIIEDIKSIEKIMQQLTIQRNK